MRDRVALASILALMLAALEAVGAPSSEFAPKDSLWWALDPIMLPALLAGVALAFIALIASVVSGVGTAAIACLCAALSTAAGVVIAAGTSDHRALTFYAVNVALVAIPAVVAVNVVARRGTSPPAALRSEPS
jgi:peptidoglycan/LPS O-acetylase OafA/YrhL